MPIAFGDTPITSVSRGANAIASAALERLGFPGQTANVFSAISPPDAPTNVAITVEEDFSPSYITGLQLWLDASDDQTLYDATTGGSLVAADGGVARWEDKSGNGNHATQGTSANRPARKTAIAGGLDVLRFDGSDDVMPIGSVSAFETASTTQFVVAIVPTASPAVSSYIMNHQYNSGATTSSQIFYSFVFSTASSGSLFFNARTADGSIVVPDAADRPKPTANQVFVLTGRSSPSGIDVILNGAASVSVAATVATPSGHIETQIGNRSGGASPFSGDIAEIIIYDSALSDTDREAVEDYLMDKWSIT